MLLALERKSRNLLLLLLSLVFLVLVAERVRNTSSDPRGTLLVSEAIIHHGTLRLDHIDKPTLQSYGYVFYEKNGHFYNYFPLGSAILSVPVVALANAMGIEMRAHEPIVQMVIVAVICLTLFLVLFETAILFLPVEQSLLLTPIVWFGSAYTSTAGTALWSHDFAVLFGSIAIFLVLRACRDHHSGGWFWVSVCLFLAYLSRPTMALLAPFLFFYWGLHDRGSVVKSALGLSALLALFVAFSFYEFGQYLPDYYLPKRLEGGSFWTALAGNMVSPARGLFVYSPMLLLVLLLIPFALAGNKSSGRLLILAVAWPLVHWVFVSRFPHWWAGWSYGSRLMTDVLPGLCVGFFAAYEQVSKTWMKRIATVVLLVTGAMAMYINTVHGVFDRYAVLWNVEPNIDQNPEYLFDWRYPPFLHNKNRHEARLQEFNQRPLKEKTGI